MATEKAIIAAVKKVGLGGKNMNVVKSVPKVAEELGEELTGALVGEIYDAEPKAFPELEIKATPAAIKAARNDGLRIERIAARTGMTTGEVRKIADDQGVGSGFYVGRGRRPGNGNGASAKSTAKPASSGRRGRGAKAADETKAASTSGRRGRKPAAEKAAPKTRGRRGTRGAANPK